MSTAIEIQKKIDKLKANKQVPDAMKQQLLKKYKKQLADAVTDPIDPGKGAKHDDKPQPKRVKKSADDVPVKKSKTNPKYKEGQEVYLGAPFNEIVTIDEVKGWNAEIGQNEYRVKFNSGEKETFPQSQLSGNKKAGKAPNTVEITEHVEHPFEDQPERIKHDFTGTYGKYYFRANTSNSQLFGYGSDGIKNGSVYRLDVTVAREGAPEMREGIAQYWNKWNLPEHRPKSAADKKAVAAIVAYLDNATLKGAKPKKGKKPRTEYKYKGKEIKTLTREECDELHKEVAERRQKQKKAEKKTKSRPVAEKVASSVVKGAKHVIKNVSAAEIKDDPKGEIDKMKKFIELTRKYIADSRALLGEDYDKETVDAEVKELRDIVKELEKKYK